MAKLNLILSCLLVFVGMQAQALLKCDKDDRQVVGLAQEMYDAVAKFYQDGIVVQADLHHAQIFLNEAKYCSQVISKKEFCDSTLPIIQKLNSRSISVEGRGSSFIERRERITRLAEIKSLCRGN